MTTPSGHSPKPWRREGAKGCDSIIASNGDEVCCLSGLADEDQNEANGNLIEIAPDLLETLQACEAFLRWGAGNEKELQKQVRELLAKAEPKRE